MLLILVLTLSGTAFFLYKIGDRIVEEAFNVDLGTDMLDVSTDNAATLPSVNDGINNNSGDLSPSQTNSLSQINQTSSGNPSEEKSDNGATKGSEGSNEGVMEKPQNKSQNDTYTKQIPSVALQTPAQPVEVVNKNVIDLNKIKKIKESVTPQDKMMLAADVLKKFSQDEINQVTELVKGGVTEVEKQKIKEIVNVKFSQDEIEKLKTMFQKYNNM